MAAFLLSAPREVLKMALESPAASSGDGYSDRIARLSLYLDVDMMRMYPQTKSKSFADYGRIWGWDVSRVKREWSEITYDVWLWCSNGGQTRGSPLAQVYLKRILPRSTKAHRPSDPSRPDCDPSVTRERPKRDPKKRESSKETKSRDPSVTRERPKRDPLTKDPDPNPDPKTPPTPSARGRGGAEPYPDCVGSGVVRAAVWDEWIAYRREKRKALTPTTISRQSAELTKHATDGHDPNQLLLASITNGWTGIAKPDWLADSGGKGGTAKGAKQQRREAAADPAAALDRLRNGRRSATG